MKFRSGFISVVGIPNAGKSSLVNALVEESVSIVSHKPQTTRKRTTGIYSDNAVQMIFVDTPGMTESAHGLNLFLKEELKKALEDDVDVVVGLIAPWEFAKKEKPWVLTALSGVSKPVLFVVSQADGEFGKPGKVKEFQSQWQEWGAPQDLLFTSSKTKKGLDTLNKELKNLLPVGPAYYDAEIYTTQTMRELAAEEVRKHCFDCLHQEVPYGLAVDIQSFKEGPIIKIAADIIISKPGHKAIVIGKGGKQLKEIGQRARLSLEKIFDSKVFLKLHVVVKPNWLKDRLMLEGLGYHGIS